LLNWIVLDEEPTLVESPIGMVYSTKPLTVLAGDGRRYFVKGPATETLVAEAVGYELASMIGLDVPEWAFCRDPRTGVTLFACRGVRFRTGIGALLAERNLVVNPDFLPTCIAFDVWVSNRDRNEGNIVAEPVGGREGSEVRLYAIDFEKSDILRGVNRFEVSRYLPRDCWPKGTLIPHCTQLKMPSTAVNSIRALSRDAIEGIFRQVSLDLPGKSVTWIDGASDFLVRRAERIHELIAEAWNA
jgi:hypothetical protein